MAEKTKTEKIPECCKPRKKGVAEGILSGTIPHIGCIAIILFSLLGTTVASGFFRKFFYNSYYLYIVIFLSFVIATLSAFLYIRRFSDRSLKTHWKYLAVLYSSVAIINLLMIYVIFPYAANISASSVKEIGEIKIVTLQVKIPCPGHAPLITEELKKIPEVKSVKFRAPNYFDVECSQSLDETKLLEMGIFKEFPCTIVK